MLLNIHREEIPVSTSSKRSHYFQKVGLLHCPKTYTLNPVEFSCIICKLWLALDLTLEIKGVSQNEGYPLRGLYNKVYNIFGSILGSPHFRKLPDMYDLLFWWGHDDADIARSKHPQTLKLNPKSLHPQSQNPLNPQSQNPLNPKP